MLKLYWSADHLLTSSIRILAFPDMIKAGDKRNVKFMHAVALN
jgi:hypothetical protein